MNKLLLFPFILLSLTVYSQSNKDKDKETGSDKEKCECEDDNKVKYNCCTLSLPVTIKSFKATQNGPLVTLKWEVGLEVNHSHYEIERSLNGLQWLKIGDAKNHFFQDTKPEAENYYRLVSVDIDGTKHFYNIIYLKTELQAFEVFDIYGKALGFFKCQQDLPRNKTLIINKQKILLR
jgi:hypothetical protein